MTVEKFEALAKRLQQGEAVLFPTDTLPALATIPAAAGRIWQLKQRPADKPLILMGASAEQLLPALGQEPPEGWQELANLGWPGALTLVLPATGPIVESLNPGGSGSLGLRVPACEAALELLRTSGPLATSSANRSGERTVPPKIHAPPWRYRQTDVEDLLARSDVWSVEPTRRGLVVNFGWARGRGWTAAMRGPPMKGGGRGFSKPKTTDLPDKLARELGLDDGGAGTQRRDKRKPTRKELRKKERKLIKKRRQQLPPPRKAEPPPAPAPKKAPKEEPKPKKPPKKKPQDDLPKRPLTGFERMLQERGLVKRKEFLVFPA